ncbi:MAG TPA: SpoIVB peptidase S55 domain-containing protein [Blastocatellia bacterium]|nr:SpoIVB peptidase S55 domain-containing protein [Blastocatellia bacterium]
MKHLFTALCFIVAMAGFASASDSTNSSIMSVEEIRPGMKGYGMTVFQGSKPERFDVEVLGVISGVWGPKQNIIIARLGGPLVERTSVFAGMSGSPVYIDGRIVGAVAYAFPFAKEPIAGITPIKEMIQIFERAAGEEQRTSSRQSFNTLMSQATGTNNQPPARVSAQIGPQAATNTSLVPYIGQTIVPIATPVTFTGVPQSVLDVFADEFRKIGIQPVAGLGGGSRLGPMAKFDDNTLTPGSSINVQLVRGDFSLDAAGTVTYRDGERIYAFGHPFLSSGKTSWPMAESSVVTVVPNLNNSFKLAAGGSMVGSINQDRATGVFGRLGDEPQMIPVHLTVHTSRNKTEEYKFELVSDSFLTPLLMRITMYSAINATERQLGNQTIKVKGKISVKGQPDILLDNSFSASNGVGLLAVNDTARPLAVLFNSGFDAVDVRSIDVDVTSEDTRSSGTLTRLWIDKTEVRAGETVEIQAFARNDNGNEFVERIPLTIPADAPAGPLVIIVGDGASINQVDRMQPAADFTPKDLSQLVRAINKLKKNNRLYVKVMRAGAGAIVNNEEMPVLPPSVIATLGSQRTSGGYTPLSIATLSEQELAPSQFVISGQQSITINVIK